MNLAEYRELFGMTQQELADKARVGVQTVSRIERGMPTNKLTVTRLADALGIKTSEITGVKLTNRVNRHKKYKKNAARG